MSAPVKVWLEEDAKVLRLQLHRPKANIVDAEMIAGLDAAFAHHLDHPDLHCVILDGEGPHFSFGASIEEHLPDNCAPMLKALHALIFRMLKSPVPIITAVRGQCLGGGLEVALAGHLIFACDDTKLGQPELTVGVFAPAASCLLPERVSQPVADDILFTGRSLDAQEAFRVGLVDKVAGDPLEAAFDYYDERLSKLSASSLRFAVKAARIGLVKRLKPKFDAVEKLYLDDMMKTKDAVEGLTAFLEKRPAKWENK
ncbi:MAG: cyclohexa-1,5-dienecarbonyl-CoA hydratase [Alphaproteobacteria bacterium]